MTACVHQTDASLERTFPVNYDCSDDGQATWMWTDMAVVAGYEGKVEYPLCSAHLGGWIVVASEFRSELMAYEWRAL